MGGSVGGSNPFERWRSPVVGVDIWSSRSVGEGHDALWGKKSCRRGRIDGQSQWLSVGADRSKVEREWGPAQRCAEEEGVGLG
jgi:hypothetical protein